MNRQLYIFLALGDIIEASDEYYSCNLQEWLTVPVLQVGNKLYYNNRSYRRKVTNDNN
jgi:hypothetical protein